jgi:hypothetical protein
MSDRVWKNFMDQVVGEVNKNLTKEEMKMSTATTKLQTAIEIDMEAWANFRELVDEVGERVDSMRAPCDGVSALNQITRRIVIMLHKSNELSPSPYRDRAWHVLRALVERAGDSRPPYMVFPDEPEQPKDAVKGE